MAAAEELGTAARPGGGEVTARAIVRAPAAVVFAAFVDWERQSQWIPFTRVRVVDGDGGEGSEVEAVTALGPAVLRDRMRVVRLDPPYEVRVVHFGRVLRGPGVFRCTPMRDDRTQIVLHEWFHLPSSVTRVLWPLAWPASKLSLAQALSRFVRNVESGYRPPAR